MRTCTTCGKEKSYHHFKVRDKKTGQRHKQCIQCIRAKVAERLSDPAKMAERREATKAWRLRNREHVLELMRKRYRENKARHYRQTKRWKEANPDKIREINHRYQKKLKRQVVDAYSGKCACCGVSELSFLTIDHVNNDGKEHRKTFTRNFYLLLIKDGFPGGFQVLCFNCNMGKQVNKGVCPHKSSEGSETIRKE